jgi:hypothetical protein
MEIINITPQLWQTSQITDLATALISFQSEFNKKGIKKDAKNPHLKNEYVSLDNLLNTVRPLLIKCNLVITQEMAGEYLITSLYHSSGQFKGSAMPFYPMAGNRGTNDLQNIGGGITYAKRYAIAALLGVSVDNDDDANSTPNDSRKGVKNAQIEELIGWANSKGYNIANVEQIYKLTPTQRKTILTALKLK